MWSPAKKKREKKSARRIFQEQNKTSSIMDSNVERGFRWVGRLRRIPVILLGVSSSDEKETAFEKISSQMRVNIAMPISGLVDVLRWFYLAYNFSMRNEK